MGTIKLDPQQVDAATEEFVTDTIADERVTREAVENHLQTEIDAISSASDVVDVVATKADLDEYDTSSLTANDLIKVLADETQSGASTYYRWNNNEFTLIGEVGPYYTKAETNTVIESTVTRDVYNNDDKHRQVSMGRNASVPTGDFSNGIAIGTASVADGTSIAIGYTTKANNNSLAIKGSAETASTSAAIYGTVKRGAYGIAVGGILENTNYSTALGDGSYIGMDNNGSVALGATSKATSRLEVSVGNPDTDLYGGSGSFTRRITNVTDPVNPQDAATKSYVDALVADIMEIIEQRNTN